MDVDITGLQCKVGMESFSTENLALLVRVRVIGGLSKNINLLS